MTEPHDLPIEADSAVGVEQPTPETDVGIESPHTEAQTEETNTTSQETAPVDSDTPRRTKHSFKVLFFGACAVIALIIFSIVNADKFSLVFDMIGAILSPIVIGLAIAYLCNPILKFYERVIFGKMKKGNPRRALSLLLMSITVLGFFAIIIALIVPELVRSIGQLLANSQMYLDGLLAWVQQVIDVLTANFSVDIDISDTQKLMDFLVRIFGSMEAATESLLKPLQDMILDKSFLDNVWSFITGLITTLTNVILGIFIAFYILASKEKRIAQINKFRAAFLTDKQDQKLGSVVRLVDHTFGRYVKGVLLDALAVGAVTYLLLTIFRVSEYNLLIAVICAVTNIIPFFGPFIGAIPSAIIVLISNPSKLILFLILILIIQQIEGNIIYPMIQGNSTGISSLSVLIAITVMGELFGVVGMIIGVPIFAVAVELVKQAIEERLRKRGRPTDTTYYYPDDAVGNAEEDVYYEHSHWRYKYDHSKLKVYIDRARHRFARKKRIRAKLKEKARKEKENQASSNQEN